MRAHPDIWADRPPPPPRALPAVVDQYRLVRPLGWGRSGIVCEALDASLDRRVAIKLIPHAPGPEADHPQLPPEARLASRVQDPHVVAVYDAGCYAGGVYLVMELVRGRSVQALLGAGPLPWPEATALLIAACEGVVAVHACGILHCDVKPANLLRAADGIVKLADFGGACRLDPARRSASCKQPFGTPHYMSPEQWCEEEHDERTDVYALGATYHTVLTGAPPYAGTNPLRIMLGHCAAPIPDPRTHRPEIPGACAEIVLRAMAKQRADRYDSAREFQEALRAVLLGRSMACPT